MNHVNKKRSQLRKLIQNTARETYCVQQNSLLKKQKTKLRLLKKDKNAKLIKSIESDNKRLEIKKYIQR